MSNEGFYFKNNKDDKLALIVPNNMRGLFIVAQELVKEYEKLCKNRGGIQDCETCPFKIVVGYIHSSDCEIRLCDALYDTLDETTASVEEIELIKTIHNEFSSDYNEFKPFFKGVK